MRKINLDDFEHYLRSTIRLTEEMTNWQMNKINQLRNYEYRQQKFSQLTSAALFIVMIGTPYAFYSSLSKTLSESRRETLRAEEQFKQSPLHFYQLDNNTNR
jgi:hypothetical protein